MGRFSLIGPSYQSQSILADCQMDMNVYLEQIESGVGRSGFVLYRTPGTNQLYNLGISPTRGGITFLGRSFVVAGNTLWELVAPNANPNKINRGNLVSDGQPVSFAGGGHQLLIASAGAAYVFDTSTNILTAVDPSAGANLPIRMVGYSDGIFFALVQNQAPTPWQINSSGVLDATNWPGINFASVTVFPDNPNAIFFNARLMWVFGPKGIQPYSNTGNFPFPFDVIPGTYIESGLAAPFSIAKMDNSLFWLGADERGNGMVFRANGFTPVRISNHAIEFALQGYPTIADAIAFTYQDQGHNFYVLNFPTADATWVYDAATGQWHQRGYWNIQAGKFNRHRAGFHLFNFGMHLVGDVTSGAVHQMAINIHSDNGNPLRWVRRAPHISREQEWVYFHRLQVDVEVGLGPNPPFPGNGQATFFYLADSTNAVWQVGMSDAGVITSAKNAAATASAFFLSDPRAKTSWQLTITSLGVVQPVTVPYSASYPTAWPMISTSGNTLWTLAVQQVAPGIAQLVTVPQGNLARGPLLTLRKSTDGAKTWLDCGAQDCGQDGDSMRRVIWNRLGRGRDCVFELSASDPVPWRIIDGYLKADGFEPSERMIKDLAKRA